MIYQVDVTEEDFNNAEGGAMSVESCMVAQAIKRVYSGHNVKVGVTFMYIDDDPYELPARVRDAIYAFCQEKYIPVSFTFDTETGQCS